MTFEEMMARLRAMKVGDPIDLRDVLLTIGTEVERQDRILERIVTRREPLS